MRLWGPNSSCRNTEMNKIMSGQGPSPSGTSRPVMGDRCPDEMSRAVWCQGSCKSYYLWDIYHMSDMAWHFPYVISFNTDINPLN